MHNYCKNSDNSRFFLNILITILKRGVLYDLVDNFDAFHLVL